MQRTAQVVHLQASKNDENFIPLEMSYALKLQPLTS